MGSTIRYGNPGAFVTPNVNDLGHPLSVKFQSQANAVEDEMFTVNLLEDCVSGTCRGSPRIINNAERNHFGPAPPKGFLGVK